MTSPLESQSQFTAVYGHNLINWFTNKMGLTTSLQKTIIAFDELIQQVLANMTDQFQGQYFLKQQRPDLVIRNLALLWDVIRNSVNSENLCQQAFTTSSEDFERAIASVVQELLQKQSVIREALMPANRALPKEFIQLLQKHGAIAEGTLEEKDGEYYLPAEFSDQQIQLPIPVETTNITVQSPSWWGRLLCRKPDRFIEDSEIVSEPPPRQQSSSTTWWCCFNNRHRSPSSIRLLGDEQAATADATHSRATTTSCLIM